MLISSTAGLLPESYALFALNPRDVTPYSCCSSAVPPRHPVCPRSHGTVTLLRNPSDVSSSKCVKVEQQHMMYCRRSCYLPPYVTDSLPTPCRGRGHSRHETYQDDDIRRNTNSWLHLIIDRVSFQLTK